MAVKVKPLEWENGRITHPSAKAIGGRYRLGSNGVTWLVMDSDYVTISQGHETRDAAKAAAQADFERRILSAIETD